MKPIHGLAPLAAIFAFSASAALADPIILQCRHDSSDYKMILKFENNRVAEWSVSGGQWIKYTFCYSTDDCQVTMRTNEIETESFITDTRTVISRLTGQMVAIPGEGLTSVSINGNTYGPHSRIIYACDPAEHPEALSARF